MCKTCNLCIDEIQRFRDLAGVYCFRITRWNNLCLVVSEKINRIELT